MVHYEPTLFANSDIFISVLKELKSMGFPAILNKENNFWSVGSPRQRSPISLLLKVRICAKGAIFFL